MRKLLKSAARIWSLMESASVDGSLFHMAANRGEEKATGLGASNDGSWRSYPAHSLEDRGVEEIFVGGEGEPEFIGVRLGPFRA